MRARGAKLTDIAVIVIAADEGMKPQTIESINHAKAAEVPIIIAVNKMDKPGANLDLIRGQLAEQGLQPEEWGGTTVVVPVSAHTGLGIEELLDMILLQAELLELKANPDRPGIATVIEAHLDQKLGSVATILVNAGTIRKGDSIVCAGASGKVRTLKDYKARNIDAAGPSVPVQITGLSTVVEGGDILQVVSSPEVAIARANEFALAKNTKSIHAFEGASLSMLMSRLKSGALKQLKIVLKTDTGGSLEALKAALAKLSTPETQVVFIHAALGDVNQSDVMMAGTSQALLIAYNVGVIPSAKQSLSQSKIEFIDKKVIYHVLEKVEAIITGMIDIRYEEQELGTAKVKAIFYTGKNNAMMIVGLGVTLGRIEPRSKVRVIRGDRKAGSGEVANLKKGPLDVIEALEGEECGINFKGDVKIEEGDILEFYKMVQRK
jgi:translation initiation factor IF-2